MKKFNTTGVCNPQYHYMADMSEQVAAVKQMVDAGEYFTINRARQYGKTTMLSALRKALASEYVVLSLDFQRIGDAGFCTEESFVRSMVHIIYDLVEYGMFTMPEIIAEEFEKIKDLEIKLDDLFRIFKKWILNETKPIVLMIDEVDSATNNQVFLDFLAQLRDGYLMRNDSGLPAFWSVILAGVTDIKHLKGKIRDEDQHKVNSPWNIAADFNVDMSLSEEGITGMLDEYEADHHIGMDTADIARYIKDYTSGYPFLASRICQLIDTRWREMGFADVSDAWTRYGVDEVLKILLMENNTLFDSLMGKLTNYPHLRKKLKSILLQGDAVEFLPDDESQQQLRMYGFIRNDNGKVAVTNRIFEMRLYRQFLGEDDDGDDLRREAYDQRNIFVTEDGLDVPLILEHFVREYTKLHKEFHTEEEETRFSEEMGRMLFLHYLSPIINGTGTYSIEEQTRDRKRMDVVVHYLGERYVIELKIWRGARYNAKGEEQIRSYLDYFGLDTGYMLSFNFNKKKEPGVERVEIDGKILYEGTV